MARVVGTRRHLVEPKAVAFHEEFDGQNPGIAARPHETFSGPAHALLQPGRKLLGRNAAKVENAVAVDIAPDGESHHLFTVRHHDQTGLVVEIDERFQDTRHGQQRQRLGEVLLRPQHGLSVTVVAQCPGFQHAGITHLRHGIAQRLLVVHRRKVGGVESVGAGVPLLAQAVLRIVQRPESLRDVVSFGQGYQHLARHVLEFVGHGVALAAQLLQGRRVVVGRHNPAVARRKGGRIGRRVERHGAHPEPARLLRKHQPQLTAPYDTDGLHPTIRLSARRRSVWRGTRRAARQAPRPARPVSKRLSKRRSSPR